MKVRLEMVNDTRKDGNSGGFPRQRACKYRSEPARLPSGRTPLPVSDGRYICHTSLIVEEKNYLERGINSNINIKVWQVVFISEIP
jgi:hypothetical protein